MTRLTSDDDSDAPRSIVARQTGDGDLVIVEETEDGQTDGAWLRAAPEDCVDLAGKT